MYFNRQTLVHKQTGKLARLAGDGDTTFFWGSGDDGDGAAFIGEDGLPFRAPLSDYTHLENEYGQPVGGVPQPNGPDMRLKKYVGLTAQQKAEAQEQAFIAWEAKVLAEIATSNVVSHPFANGGQCFEFQAWFLKRRSAEPLYRHWNIYEEGHKDEVSRKPYMGPIWVDGPMTFSHEGQRWLVHPVFNSLVVLK